MPQREKKIANDFQIKQLVLRIRIPTFLDETENLNIHPERWITLKSLAVPPRQDLRMVLTESTFKRKAERPKLATRWKVAGESDETGLTVQPKRWNTNFSKETPGPKSRSKSSAIGRSL